MSQKMLITTYATEKFFDSLVRVSEAVGKQSYKDVDKIISFQPYTKADLIWSKFYQKNRQVLEETPHGSWAWKPYFILRTLEILKPGDILVYMDAGDKLTDPAGMRDMLFSRMQNTSMLLTTGAFRHANWTKRDCFVAMDCDTEYYHDAIQLEAGIVVCKKDETTIQFLKQWLNWCQDYGVMSFKQPNMLGKENLPGFSEHRGDQSVLTNLYYWNLLNKIPGIEAGGEMRPFIACNQNQ